MTIQFQCEQCGATLKVKDGLGCKNVKCPKCAGVIQIPMASTSESEQPPAPVPRAQTTQPSPAPARVQNETQTDKSVGTGNLKKSFLLGGASLAIVAIVAIGIVALTGGGIGNSSTWAEAAEAANDISKTYSARLMAAHRQERSPAELTVIRDERDAAIFAVVRKVPTLAFENQCDNLFVIVEVGEPTEAYFGTLCIPIIVEPKRKLEYGQPTSGLQLTVDACNESNVVLDSRRQSLGVGDKKYLLPGQRHQLVLAVPWDYSDPAKSNLHHASVRLSEGER